MNFGALRMRNLVTSSEIIIRSVRYEPCFAMVRCDERVRRRAANSQFVKLPLSDRPRGYRSPGMPHQLSLVSINFPSPSQPDALAASLTHLLLYAGLA